MFKHEATEVIVLHKGKMLADIKGDPLTCEHLFKVPYSITTPPRMAPLFARVVDNHYSADQRGFNYVLCIRCGRTEPE